MCLFLLSRYLGGELLDYRLGFCLKETVKNFPGGCTMLYLVISEGSGCSIFLLMFGIVSSLNFSHSNVCEFVSHGDFNLNFSDNWFCCTTFHVGPVDIFFCEVSHLEKLKLFVFLIFQAVGTTHVF